MDKKSALKVLSDAQCLLPFQVWTSKGIDDNEERVYDYEGTRIGTLKIRNGKYEPVVFTY